MKAMFDLKLGRLSATPSRNTFTDSRGDIVKHRSQVCTRLLTVCIVIYRYVLVLHSSLVETTVQKRTFESLILATIFLLPVLVTSYGVYYRNHYYNYLGRDKSSVALPEKYIKPKLAAIMLSCRVFEKTSRVLL